MFCDNCSKLSYFTTAKICTRCQGKVLNNISVLCEVCSVSYKQCSACIKKIISAADRARNRGCNCSGK